MKKKKEVRPPDIQAKTLDAPAAPAKETDDQKAKREGFKNPFGETNMSLLAETSINLLGVTSK